jgi:hypothetical protein
MRLATGLVACLAGLTGLYFFGSGVRRPPAPAAAELPPSARVLLQPFRKSSVDLTVGAKEELNYRVGMQAGASLVYGWSTGHRDEKLLCEFAGREASEGASEAHNAFVAQSAGWYRWRWKNQNGRPVSIHLTLSGYYEPVSVPKVGMPYDR